MWQVKAGKQLCSLFVSYIIQIYDKCFTEFFQKFISPNYRHQYAVNPCDRLHEVYKECIEEVCCCCETVEIVRFKKLVANRPFEIDLQEIRKEYLDTDEDKFQN